MLNEEYTPEVEQDENQIDIESTEGTEEESEAPTGEEKNWEAEAKKWKAIAERKAKREAQAPKVAPQNLNNNQLSEELKLIAKGLSDEEIEQAKVIAKGRGTNLAEALKDPMFTAFQKELKEQARKESAKLGASRGSGKADVETFRPGMTDEEHKALWRKNNG